MKHKLLGLVILLFSFQAQAATTLLPPGMQCFTDATGAVISGSVNMFVPNTTTAKATWQDSLQVTLNSQPIQLDGNGCATIYGVGVYRQQLYDGPVIGGNTSGNLIYDKLTTDTSAFNSIFWAGLSGGTANVITIVDPGFNGTDGSVINFTALATNTGSTTITISPFGTVSVVKSTTAGPVSLVGGEIIQGNQISVIYSASANTFTILNPPIPSASANIAPLCGANGLVIKNGGTPSSVISITANQAVMLSAGGLVLSRSSISLANLNITTGTSTSTANGMDGEAPGVSGFLYIWLIDNGSATAALASLASGNGLAPSLPSGYIYKCRVGAIAVDGSGNLYRYIQNGSFAQPTVITPSNSPSLPKIACGASGSVTAPTWTNVDLAAGGAIYSIPPTATAVQLKLLGADANGRTMAAPNNQYGAFTSTTNPPFCHISGSTGGVDIESTNCLMQLESAGNIYYALESTGECIFQAGWKDNVNAN